MAGNRWISSGAPRGDDYDALVAARLAGKNPHGEADLIVWLLARERVDYRVQIVDGGCGTGRVAIELARRGYSVVGVDSDPQMLEVARRNAPRVDWVLGDLATVQLVTTPDM